MLIFYSEIFFFFWTKTYIELFLQPKRRKTFLIGPGQKTGQVLHASDSNSPLSMVDKSISLPLLFFGPFSSSRHAFRSHTRRYTPHARTHTLFHGSCSIKERVLSSGCGLNESLISLGVLAPVTTPLGCHHRPLGQTPADEVFVRVSWRTL